MVKNNPTISFKVKDNVLGQALSPNNVTLSILSEFSEQVAKFLRGSKGVDLSKVKTSIKTGSLALEIEDQTGLLEDAVEDYETAVKEHRIDAIDPVRAQIIEQWQAAAKKNKDRVYELFFGTQDNIAKPLIISYETNFVKKKEVWVEIEDYVYGRIYDMGGKTQPNVHIELENGKTLTVSSEASVLVEDRTNRLYRKQLLRISAKQNIYTKKLKDEKLISFESYSPSFDENEFMSIVKKARVAWQDVKSASRWVESLRGDG